MDFFQIQEQIKLTKISIENLEKHIKIISSPKKYIFDYFTNEDGTLKVIFTDSKNTDFLIKDAQIRYYSVDYKCATFNIVVRTKKCHERKYNRKPTVYGYGIDSIIDAEDFTSFLSKEIILLRKSLKEKNDKMTDLLKDFKKMKNPNLLKYKETISFLEEAQKSAISSSHKYEIEIVIKKIKANDDVRNILDKVPHIWYYGAKQYASSLIRRLGGKKYYKSNKDVSGSVYYELPNIQKIRLTDHELPSSDRRDYNRAMGLSGEWIEIILDEPMPFKKLKTKILKIIKDNLRDDTVFSEETKKISDSI